MAVKQIGYVALMVKDVAKATEFYTKHLGLTPVPDQSQPGAFTSFALERGTMLGVVSATTGLEVPGFSEPYEVSLEVDDVEAAYRGLEAAGVRIFSEPHDMPFGRTFHIRTPDGHTLRLYQPPAKK
jgi:catechol 2,3-dioxygenase-like lactoylglutathione lyase family enzyme